MDVDPSITAVVLGVVSNALFSLMSQLGLVSWERSEGGRLLAAVEERSRRIEPRLTAAIDKFANVVRWDGPRAVEEVCIFLRSADIHALLSRYYSARFLDGANKGSSLELESSSTLEHSFHLLMSKHLDVNIISIADAAHTIFRLLIDECNLAFAEAIPTGSLTAHDALSTFRTRLLRDQLDAIEKTLVFLARRTHPSPAELDAFERQYRIQVAYRHRNLTPPFFEAVRTFPIDRMYVPPRLEPFEQTRSSIVDSRVARNSPASVGRAVSYRSFFSTAHRAVVLGHPGAGKSSLAQKLCYDLAGPADPGATEDQLVPILVVVKDYAAQKQQYRDSILNFIHTTAANKYQIASPAGAFEYLLHVGRALVIFDGLDEVLESGYRRDVSADIEAFANLFPTIPIIVTSREIGYQEAPLDPERFKIFRLLPFDDNQVTMYVENWFEAIEEITGDYSPGRADAFLVESSSVPDLRSNPLLLALLCNIYRGERSIPKNRPSVYEKCSVMLLEQWDRSRNINTSWPFRAHRRPALNFLAYWLYSDITLAQGVAENLLVDKVVEYLLEYLYNDRFKASDDAGQFVAICRSRAWVFTDVGIDASGEPLYQFTHRTFLEYFAASYLTATCTTPFDLVHVLMPRIDNAEWDMLAQLALHQKAEGLAPRGADELITALLEGSELRGIRIEARRIIFLLRCLEFLVPREVTVQRVVLTALRIMEQLTPSDFTLGRIISGLLDAPCEENLHAVINGVRVYTERKMVEIPGTSHDKLLNVLELLRLGVRERLNEPRIAEARMAELGIWLSGLNRVIDDFAADFVHVWERRKDLALAGWYGGSVSLENYCHWHGGGGLLSVAVFHLGFDRLISLGVITTLAGAIIEGRVNVKVIDYFRELTKCMSILLEGQFPWLRQIEVSEWKGDSTSMISGSVEWHGLPLGEYIQLGPLEYFTAFVIVASAAEIEIARRGDPTEALAEVIAARRPNDVRMICQLVLSRWETRRRGRAQRIVETIGFNSIQKDFVERWIRGTVSFVE